MKKFIFFVLSFTVMLATSCTSTPSLQTPGFKVSYYPQSAVTNGIFGNTQDENPYFEPTSLLRSREYEFIVLRFDFALEKESHVDIVAQALSEGLGSVAELKTKDEMQFFWEGWPGNTQLNRQRAQILSQTYIPDFSFVASKGKRSYYCILMGRNPIVRPTVIKGRIQAEGLPVKLFEIQLPERNQKIPVEAILQ